MWKSKRSRFSRTAIYIDRKIGISLRYNCTLFICDLRALRHAIERNSEMAHFQILLKEKTKKSRSFQLRIRYLCETSMNRVCREGKKDIERREVERAALGKKFI